MGKKSGFGKFLVGIGAGVGLGFLFAPEKGSETRKALKVKLQELVNEVKNLDAEDVKFQIEEQIAEIKQELEELDKEKVLNLAKEKSEKIKKSIEDLYNLAKEKATPVIETAVEELRSNAINVTKEVLAKLEEPKKNSKVSDNK